MSDTDDVIKAEEYASIIKTMGEDLQRSKREREVERIFNKSIPTILAELDQQCSTRTEILDRLNTRLEANAHTTKISRPTLYRWLEKYDLK